MATSVVESKLESSEAGVTSLGCVESIGASAT
jgi:hypothetical protein